MEDQGAIYAGISESQTYKEGQALSDTNWKWEEGTETSPSEEGSGAHTARGIGAWTHNKKIKASIIRKSTYLLWHRLDLQQGGKDLAVGTAYFPNAQNIKGHTAANEELRGDINVLSDLGYSLVLGGDFNAHTGSNGDKRPIDKAGRMFLNSIEDAGLVMINTLPGKCSGGPTRVQVQKDVTQESTLDYIICTQQGKKHADYGNTNGLGPLPPSLGSHRLNRRPTTKDQSQVGVEKRKHSQPRSGWWRELVLGVRRTREIYRMARKHEGHSTCS